MSSPTDQSLREAFGALARGDMAALEEVWRECSAPLHNYAYALTGSQDEADDILSDVLARLAQRGWRLRLVGNPKAYLFTAIRNAVRSLKRSRPNSSLVADGLDATYAGQDEAVAVREAVLALPMEQREIVVLHIWGGLTFEEIGRTVGVSPNTAASRYRYALGKLRVALRDEDDG